MPPLLPEYLSRPVENVLQSLPEPTHVVINSLPTDWAPVWLGAAATLLGAAIGAGFGGWVAYRGTIKANNTLLKREKLEEALTIILQLERSFTKIGEVLSTQGDSKWLADHELKAILDEAKKIKIDDVKHLQILLRLYEDSLEIDVGDLVRLLRDLKYKLTNIDWYRSGSKLSDIVSECFTIQLMLKEVLTYKLKL